MNIVEQIVSAVQVSAKVATQVFMAAFAAVAVEHYFPSLFIGLPEWIVPTLRLLAIFTFVLTAMSALAILANKSKTISIRILKPLRSRWIMAELLQLPIGEVLILSRGLCNFERDIRMKPDLPQVLSLQERGMIKKTWSGVAYGDGLSDFSIPIEIWKILTNMEEFSIADPNRSRNPLMNGGNEQQILDALPQKHPSVIGAKVAQSNSQPDNGRL